MYLVSFHSSTRANRLPGFLTYRYAITDASADWSMAESQVAKLANGVAGGKSSVVSVKSAASTGQKRKAGELESVPKMTDKKSGARRSMKKAKR